MQKEGIILVLLSSAIFQAFSQDSTIVQNAIKSDTQITKTNANTCYPPCRIGYVCKNGECVSQCNPPCEPGFKCLSLDCVPIRNNIVTTQNQVQVSQSQGGITNPYADYSRFPVFWMITTIAGAALLVGGAAANPQNDESVTAAGIGIVMFAISLPTFLVKKSDVPPKKWTRDQALFASLAVSYCAGETYPSVA